LKKIANAVSDTIKKKFPVIVGIEGLDHQEPQQNSNFIVVATKGDVATNKEEDDFSFSSYGNVLPERPFGLQYPPLPKGRIHHYRPG
jgi:hypothetical protein